MRWAVETNRPRLFLIVNVPSQPLVKINDDDDHSTFCLRGPNAEWPTHRKMSLLPIYFEIGWVVNLILERCPSKWFNVPFLGVGNFNIVEVTPWTHRISQSSSRSDIFRWVDRSTHPCHDFFGALGLSYFGEGDGNIQKHTPYCGASLQAVTVIEIERETGLVRCRWLTTSSCCKV